MSSNHDDKSVTPSRPFRARWREWLFGEEPESGSESRGLSSPPEAAPPARLGRYRLEEKLGQGGMGVVYAAVDESLGRRVALKTIVAPDEEARRRFHREARTAAGVSHPNVCPLFEIGEDEGRLYLVMELLSGETLAERLRRGPLAIGEALVLGREILSALQALHGLGVVHRDLKPSNVFLTPHGSKLLDFGLARPILSGLSSALDLESDLTRSGLIVGSPRYMAPEQVQGRAVDARTDLFAAGALLFEALSGRPAFPGTTAVEVFHATLHEQPPALAGSAAVVAFDRVLRRALAKDPAARFADAAGMARELEQVEVSGSSDAVVRAQALTRLVVLPFRLLRADPEIEFLKLALSDAVSSTLRGRPSLVVRSSAAGARFATEAPDFRALASELDVDHVLTGTLLRSGDRLRLSAQLVEAPSGTLAWSHSVQSEVVDLFRLQDELARGIVDSLAPSLGGDPASGRSGTDTPRTPRAYELYLRGTEAARDILQLRVARDLFRGCLDEDPAFAPAWAHLGRAHRVIGKYLEVESWPDHQARAEEAFRRALDLRPGLAVAHKFYAHLEAELGRAQDAALRLVQLARNDRDDPELFAGLVHVCRYCGLTEASHAAHREARRLDPHLSTGVAHTVWTAADFEALLETTGEDDAESGRAVALAALGRDREAAEQWAETEKRELQTPLTPVLRAWLDVTRAVVHPSPAGQEAVRRCLSFQMDPEGMFACAVYGCRVGLPGVVDILRGAVERGYHAAIPLARHPWLDPVRGEPGFAEILAQAQAKREEARVAFRAAGGDRLLGL